jgi:geranylgeranyl transferase type-1 subunit beta
MISSKPFYLSKHVQYFVLCSRLLPHHYVQLDSSRLTALYFIVVALDMLNSLSEFSKPEAIEFIYRLQLIPSNQEEVNNGHFGFIGSPYLGCESSESTAMLRNYQQGQLAMIYTAIMTLLTLDDDLSRVDRISIGKGLQSLQQANGTFLSYQGEGETDLRYMYCACAIASVLNLWDFIDKQLIIKYIMQCLTYEGGFGLNPGE